MAKDSMVGEIRSPWADLHPELLNLIYEKLPPSPTTLSSGFGSVCKPWPQFHAAVPLPTRHPSYCPRKFLLYTTVDAIPDAMIRHQLQDAYIAYSWPSNGWLMLRHSHNVQIFGCFNPLLSWPRNYIALPEGSNSPWPRQMKAAFSSDPAGPEDWTILVAGEQGYGFSTFHRGDAAWKNYRRRYHWAIKYAGYYVAIGFRDGEFFCLFGSGDVLIFGIGEGGERRVLVADPLPAPLRDLHNLRIVERGETACVVANWKQVADRHGGGRRWRLGRVERRRKEEVERMVGAMDRERRWNLGKNSL
ncbi:unnamed protein product [Linum trigynum]|uniref:KIB1-4 beta-propeller domain-containing protein n=1 Tax=Linum trigynum TaxID=586398 RepID=A0AAV2DA04_9ROSI